MSWLAALPEDILGGIKKLYGMDRDAAFGLPQGANQPLQGPPQGPAPAPPPNPSAGMPRDSSGLVLRGAAMAQPSSGAGTGAPQLGQQPQQQQTPQLGLPTPPNPNDPRFQPQHRGLAKTIFGGLGSGLLGGPEGAREFLNEPKADAANRYKLAQGQFNDQLGLVKDQSTLGLQAAQTKKLGEPAEGKEVTPGDYIPDASVTTGDTPGYRQIGQPKTAADKAPTHFPAGEMVADPDAPGGYRQVGEPKAPAEDKPTAGTVNGKPAWGQYKPGQGWIDPQTNKSIPNFAPAPNYAEIAPGLKTIDVIDPATGLPTVETMGGKSLGVSGSGAAAGRISQAGAVERAGGDLINEITAHKDKIGNVSALVNSAILGTPWSDPETQKLHAMISTFVALNPAMHGLRGNAAIKEFYNAIGGIPNNPDALVSGIQGIMKTAGAIAPGLTPSGGGSYFDQWKSSKSKPK